MNAIIVAAITAGTALVLAFFGVIMRINNHLGRLEKGQEMLEKVRRTCGPITRRCESRCVWTARNRGSRCAFRRSGCGKRCASWRSGGGKRCASRRAGCGKKCAIWRAGCGRNARYGGPPAGGNASPRGAVEGGNASPRGAAAGSDTLRGRADAGGNPPPGRRHGFPLSRRRRKHCVQNTASRCLKYRRQPAVVLPVAETDAPPVFVQRQRGR